MNKMYALFPHPAAPSVGEVLTRRFIQNCVDRELHARLGQDVVLTGIPSRRPNIDVGQDEASHGVPFRYLNTSVGPQRPTTVRPG